MQTESSHGLTLLRELLLLCLHRLNKRGAVYSNVRVAPDDDDDDDSAAGARWRRRPGDLVRDGRERNVISVACNNVFDGVISCGHGGNGDVKP